MNPIGVAVVGASMRSTMVLRYLQDYPEVGHICGMYDIIPARGEYLLKQYDHTQARIYESLEQVVGDSDVGAVCICTSDGEHVTPAVAALKAGKHVFCEKPMTITLEDADTLIAAAQESKAVFYLGMNLRHAPVFDELHKILESGKLGRLLAIESNEHYFGGRTYFRRWNRLRKYGGGLWITKACHDFDLLNWFAGGNPTRVFGVCSLSHYKPKPGAGTHCRVCNLKNECPDYFDVSDPKAPSWGAENEVLGRLTEEATGVPRDICLYNSDKDTFDNGIAIVEYDNDVRATYTVSVVASMSTRQMRLTGTEGFAEGDLSAGTVKYWKRHAKEGNWPQVTNLRELMNSGHGGADDNLLKDFFECCRTGKKPKSSWMDGRLSVKVGLAARESCDTGKPVILK
ncbi:MAG: Gfo/Idh/MocA family oxidoreductase [Phycisphaerae bacterium]|nr:Gfo/Idh/MocA family oxidoreductase [Phycisphaerae bacterium]